MVTLTELNLKKNASSLGLVNLDITGRSPSRTDSKAFVYFNAEKLNENISIYPDT